MRSKNLAWMVLLVMAATHLSLAQAAPQPATVRARAANYGQLPLTFEKNQGQIASDVKFLSRGKGYSAYLTSGGVVLSLRKTATAGNPAAKQKSSRATVRMTLVGAAKNPAVVGEDQQVGRVNYFLGNDPAKWHTNVRTYARVRYKNVYPGIDLLYYGNHRQMEYDFEIQPGSDPRRIQFKIQGASQIDLDPAGDLVLKLASGEIRLQCPKVYQELNGRRVAIDGGYAVTDSTHVSFQLANYDSQQPLVIDPVLVYSSYLGGSGDDQPTGIAVDGTGNVYVAGFTDSTDFPLGTLGSLSVGTDHVFVAKYDPTGSSLLYADYIGGSSQDYGYALVLDSANEVYVTGSTGSSDFPVVNAFQATYPGSFNAFLAKISADGASLSYSTYLGGNGSDMPSSIALDGASNIVVAGNTTSTNFPLANAYQSTVSPNEGGLYGNYGFLTKFTADGSSLVYSTYLAGSENIPYNCGGTPCWGSPFSAIQALAIDATGNAYVTGDTNTYDFPTTKSSYLTSDSTQFNAIVGFVSKFDGAGALQYSTYFYDAAGFTNLRGIAVDASGSAYITGQGVSDATFPVTSTTICDPTVQATACSYAFVAKFDATASTLAYSTFLGVNNTASPVAIVLDQDNDAFVLATTSSNSFGLANGLEAYAGGSDLLLAEIDPVAGSEVFATYLGGSTNEYAAAMALDASGNIYITGSTDSTDFPATQGAFQVQSGGSLDGFVMKIGPASAPAVALSPYVLDFSSDQIGSTSQPQQVLLRNMGSAALSVGSISATGDFAETDNCGTSLEGASSCTMSVTFAATALGTRTGSVTVTDNASGSPHIVTLSGIGIGGIVSLAPAAVAFDNTQVGVSSSPQTVTLSNQGNGTLTISNIQVSGDYSQTGDCAGTLAASASCSINVVFTPTAAGPRAGSLVINDDAAGSPHTVVLTGTGTVGATVTLAPAAVTFASTQVKAASAPQTVTLTNQGNATLNISGVQMTGDYTQTNNCSTSLQQGASCSFNIVFTPSASGTRSGSLAISDSATGSPQTVILSGTGSDFSLATSSGSDTVTAGAAASYTMTVAPMGGSFSSQVKLACSGAPAESTCSLSPSSVVPGTNSTSVTVTITTTGTSSSAQMLPVTPGQQPRMFAALIQFPGFALFGVVFVGWKRSRAIRTLIGTAVIGMLLLLTGCAGGTGIASQGQNGTAPGTYHMTVTGTSGNLQHTLPLTLTVQ